MSDTSLGATTQVAICTLWTGKLPDPGGQSKLVRTIALSRLDNLRRLIVLPLSSYLGSHWYCVGVVSDLVRSCETQVLRLISVLSCIVICCHGPHYFTSWVKPMAFGPGAGISPRVIVRSDLLSLGYQSTIKPLYVSSPGCLIVVVLCRCWYIVLSL